MIDDEIKTIVHLLAGNRIKDNHYTHVKPNDEVIKWEIYKHMMGMVVIMASVFQSVDFILGYRRYKKLSVNRYKPN